jgi:hypothetical protein
MTTYFGNVVHVETPHNTQHTAHSTQHTAHSTQHTTHNTQHTTHNTAEISIVVSTARAMVESTSSSDDSLARKRHSSLMLMVD